MSINKMYQFSRKYGKKFGGVLFVEGSRSGDNLIPHEALEGKLDIPDNIVTLTGFVEYNEAKRRRTGKDGDRIETGYVVSFAVNDGNLYAITKDSVYRLQGPYLADIVVENPFLKSLWEDVKKSVIEQMMKAKKKG